MRVFSLLFFIVVISISVLINAPVCASSSSPPLLNEMDRVEFEQLLKHLQVSVLSDMHMNQLSSSSFSANMTKNSVRGGNHRQMSNKFGHHGNPAIYNPIGNGSSNEHAELPIIKPFGKKVELGKAYKRQDTAVIVDAYGKGKEIASGSGGKKKQSTIASAEDSIASLNFAKKHALTNNKKKTINGKSKSQTSKKDKTKKKVAKQNYPPDFELIDSIRVGKEMSGIHKALSHKNPKVKEEKSSINKTQFFVRKPIVKKTTAPPYVASYEAGKAWTKRYCRGGKCASVKPGQTIPVQIEIPISGLVSSGKNISKKESCIKCNRLGHSFSHATHQARGTNVVLLGPVRVFHHPIELLMENEQQRKIFRSLDHEVLAALDRKVCEVAQRERVVKHKFKSHGSSGESPVIGVEMSWPWPWKPKPSSPPPGNRYKPTLLDKNNPVGSGQDDSDEEGIVCPVKSRLMRSMDGIVHTLDGIVHAWNSGSHVPGMGADLANQTKTSRKALGTSSDNYHDLEHMYMRDYSNKKHFDDTETDCSQDHLILMVCRLSGMEYSTLTPLERTFLKLSLAMALGSLSTLAILGLGRLLMLLFFGNTDNHNAENDDGSDDGFDARAKGLRKCRSDGYFVVEQSARMVETGTAGAYDVKNPE